MCPVVARRAVRAISSLGLGAYVATAMMYGCSSTAAQPTKCTIDEQCGLKSQWACMSSVCVPRSMDDRTVAVEIVPRPDSTAARTGIPNVAVGAGQIDLAADDPVVIDATVTYAPNAHVILLAANPIPGQVDLQFETELVDSNFQITVGSRLIRSLATIWLIPNAAANQPPVPFATMLASTLNFTFPPEAQMTIIRGYLHNSLDGPAVGYQARVSVADKVVSSVATTDADGMFRLLIAPGAVANDPSLTATIEFTPALSDSGPRFETNPFLLATAVANNAPPRTFRMPASLKPAHLIFAVQSANSKAPVADVTMRFRTVIDGGMDGTAIFEQEKRSTTAGEVDVMLIPGTATDPRNYQISILPSPDSPYGSRCIAENAVTNVGTSDQKQYSATFTLDPKVILNGTISGNGATPAATVSVTATPLPGMSDCTNAIPASPVSSTTSRTGYYEMLVDPGAYRVDVDPPTGSDVPRLTEDGDQAVIVSTDSTTTHNVTLPAGEVIEGDVKGTDKTPLGLANIKIFHVACEGDTCGGPSRIPPVLQAQTRTDVGGHFRAVLPLP